MFEFERYSSDYLEMEKVEKKYPCSTYISEAHRDQMLSLPVLR